jgi:hypothetical protein
VAANIYSGKTITVDCYKKKENSYSTISEALNVVSSLDRILINEGEYAEEIFIKKPIIIEGIGRVTVLSKKRPTIQVNLLGCCKVQNMKLGKKIF